MTSQSHFPNHMRPVPQGRTQFRSAPGYPAHLQLDRDESSIVMRNGNPQDRIVVSGDENQAKVDRYGPYQDTTITKQGENIRVDRYGFEDLEVSRDENNLFVDRPGFDMDVRASFSDDHIRVRQAGSIIDFQKQGDEVLVRQDGFAVDLYPAALMPGGGWPESPSLSALSGYTGIEDRAADSIDRWSETGIQFDDLVRVTKNGEVWTFDDEFSALGMKPLAEKTSSPKE